MVYEDGERLSALLAKAEARAEEAEHDAVFALVHAMLQAQQERQCRPLEIFMSPETRLAMTRQMAYLSGRPTTPRVAAHSSVILVGEPLIAAIINPRDGQAVTVTPEEALAFGLAHIKYHWADGGKRALVPCFLTLERWR